MTTNATSNSGRTSLARSALFRGVRLATFGFVGSLLFGANALSSADDAIGRGVFLVAVLALAALTSITWYVFRARADRRWRAALERFAAREMATETHSRKRHQR
jgi:hypothetical protein